MGNVIDGIYFIQGQDEMIPDSHVYVIGEPSSNDLSIIDAGLTGKGNYKVGAIRKMGIEISAIKRIIMTHTHLDHIGCLREIKDQLPHAEIWIHRLEAELLESGDDRMVYGLDMFKGMCQSQYGLKPDDFIIKSDRKLEGGEHLEIGNMAWEVIHIPGHSLGGIALYSSSLKVLIPGDVVYADYAIGRFDLFGADKAALQDSLKRLAGLEIDTLLPGHNQIVKSLPRDYMQEVGKMWKAYLT